MNNHLPLLAVYPSQLDAFKEKAKLLSNSISKNFSIKQLSAFKRNDYLAIALRYKGHPDLIESSKFRLTSDKAQQLIIFSNEAVRLSIAEVFSKKISAVGFKDVLSICEELERSEINSLAISEPKRWFFDEYEWATSPEEVANRQRFASFLTEREILYTPKKSNVKILIDFSEVPTFICHEFYGNPQWIKFESEANLESRDHNVVFDIIGPEKSSKKPNQWKIRASIDTWSELAPTCDLLTLWSEFKEWLLSFYATDRIHVSERIASHRWGTQVMQFYVNNPIEHQLSQLTKLEDIALFNLLSID